jgi:hypothetical protein
MSNYYFKNIPISTIVSNGPSAPNAPAYNNFPCTSTPYTALIPSDFSFYYTSSGSVVSVSSISTAPSTVYTTSNTTSDLSFNIQNTYPGCKAISFCGVSGGGGGGSAAGAALLKVLLGNSGNADSGPGGFGGNGGLIYGYNIDLTPYKTMQINVGKGGNGSGLGGQKAVNYEPAGKAGKATGRPANNGGIGNATSIILSNTDSLPLSFSLSKAKTSLKRASLLALSL